MKIWQLVFTFIGTILTALSIALPASFAILGGIKGDIAEKLEVIVENQSLINERIASGLHTMDKENTLLRERHQEDSRRVNDDLQVHKAILIHQGADLRLNIVEEDIKQLQRENRETIRQYKNND